MCFLQDNECVVNGTKNYANLSYVISGGPDVDKILVTLKITAIHADRCRVIVASPTYNLTVLGIRERLANAAGCSYVDMQHILRMLLIYDIPYSCTKEYCRMALFSELRFPSYFSCSCATIYGLVIFPLVLASLISQSYPYLGYHRRCQFPVLPLAPTCAPGCSRASSLLTCRLRSRPA